MRIVIDIGHPAHVHLFKNFILKMKKKGHKIIVTARDKECALHLLNYYKIKYVNRGSGQGGLIGKALNLIKTDIRLYKIVKKFKPDILLGVNNPYIAHVAWLLRKPSYLFNDTEHAKLSNIITYPFATKIITPSSFKKNLGKKQIQYNGYHELAYLHPDYFKPNPNILKELGLKKEEKFFVIRLVAWEASHDIGHKGLRIEAKRKLIRILKEYGKVFISSEKPLPKEFKRYELKISPEKIHNVLYYATMYVGDGGTMGAEAAVLGTPSIHISTTAKYCGIFKDLNKYGLIFTYSDDLKTIRKTKELLKKRNLKQVWRERREKMLKDKIDVTKWMINFVEKLGGWYI